MVYRHLKGGLYTYIGTGRIEADGVDGVEQVVYQSLKDGRIWIRPKEEWKDKFSVIC